MRFLAMNALACALVAGLIAPAEAKFSLKKLRSCLEFKDRRNRALIAMTRSCRRNQAKAATCRSSLTIAAF